jgi:hypothetical protein
MASSVCRDCGAPITFRQTKAGKWQPIDVMTGEVHFAVCSAKTRSTPRKGSSGLVRTDVCYKCGSLDVIQVPGSGPHWGALRCNDCGAHRWLGKPSGEVA